LIPLILGAPDSGKNGRDVNGVPWDIVEGAEDVDYEAGMCGMWDSRAAVSDLRSDIALREEREDSVQGGVDHRSLKNLKM
jgi:hypothetical protein